MSCCKRTAGADHLKLCICIIMGKQGSFHHLRADSMSSIFGEHRFRQLIPVLAYMLASTGVSWIFFFIFYFLLVFSIHQEQVQSSIIYTQMIHAHISKSTHKNYWQNYLIRDQVQRENALRETQHEISWVEGHWIMKGSATISHILSHHNKNRYLWKSQQTLRDTGKQVQGWWLAEMKTPFASLPSLLVHSRHWEDINKHRRQSTSKTRELSLDLTNSVCDGVEGGVGGGGRVAEIPSDSPLTIYFNLWGKNLWEAYLTPNHSSPLPKFRGFCSRELSCTITEWRYPHVPSDSADSQHWPI